MLEIIELCKIKKNEISIVLKYEANNDIIYNDS